MVERIQLQAKCPALLFAKDVGDKSQSPKWHPQHKGRNSLVFIWLGSVRECVTCYLKLGLVEPKDLLFWVARMGVRCADGNQKRGVVSDTDLGQCARRGWQVFGGVHVVESKLVLLPAWQASISRGELLGPGTVTVFRKPADWEDDELGFQRTHLIWDRIQTSFMCKGKAVSLAVTNFLLSESFVLASVHLGRVMTFLWFSRIHVILCSAASYLYVNGKVLYP